MKRLAFLLIFILLANVSAIRINEVELNPAGDDSGNEWVEIYFDEEIDIEDFSLKNNDGKEIGLEGDFEEFFVFVFPKQWLDNSDEKVYLYEKGNLIDETKIIYDSKNDRRTLQICRDKWEFLEETKGEKNDCEKEEEIENKTAFTKATAISSKVINENGPETIFLMPQNIKSENVSESLDKEDFSKYGLFGFGILILALFLLRKNRYEKNEFR